MTYGRRSRQRREADDPGRQRALTPFRLLLAAATIVALAIVLPFVLHP